MKRKWNWPIWVGFIIAVGGLFSYEFFVQFPVTRDFPWVNLTENIAVRARPEQVLKAFEMEQTAAR